MDPLRPSVSRETRLLLSIVVISVALLWVLARIRFPGRGATPNPVPTVLAQLAPPSAFDDIASTVGQLTPHIGELVSAIVVSTDSGSAPQSAAAQALRIRDGVAIALISEGDKPRTTEGGAIEITARDPATGLTLLRVPAEDSPAPDVWSSSRGGQHPRFFIASDVSLGGVSLRPVFIGALNAITSPRWSASLWAVPYGTELRTGTFLFTVAGEFAGVAIEDDDHMAIVPAELLMTAVDRLSRQPNPTPATLGVEVQALTPTLAAALHASSGVVVAWVDPAGPAAGLLSPFDVVDRANGNAVTSPNQWEAQVLGLSDGGAVLLDVRRQGEKQQVQVVARGRSASADDAALGLSLRTIPRTGVEVVYVLPRSAAARAGIQAGDIITRVDNVETPSSANISRLFAAEPQGGSLVVALTRNQDHRVMAIKKER
jgi:PDZ domain